MHLYIYKKKKYNNNDIRLLFFRKNDNLVRNTLKISFTL